MQQTNIFTLKSQQHIVGDDISALRDGITGDVTVGITSPGDYDKFYIASTTGTFKNAFVPSTAIYDDVLASNVPDKTSVLGVVNTYKLTKTKASLKVNCKTVRPFNYQNATFRYEAAPTALLKLFAQLNVSIQTKLIINTANLNLRMKMFYKTIPMIIGMDFLYGCEYGHVYRHQIVTIIDPGYDQITKDRAVLPIVKTKCVNTSGSGRHASATPANGSNGYAKLFVNETRTTNTYNELSRGATSSVESNSGYIARAFTGAETVKMADGSRGHYRGIYYLNDPFRRINSYLLNAGYNTPDEVASWNPTPQTTDNGGLLFPIRSVFPSGSQNTSYNYAISVIQSLAVAGNGGWSSSNNDSGVYSSYITICAGVILFSVLELNDVCSTGGSTWDGNRDTDFPGQRDSVNYEGTPNHNGTYYPCIIGAVNSPIQNSKYQMAPRIITIYVVSAYDYINRKWGFDVKPSYTNGTTDVRRKGDLFNPLGGSGTSSIANQDAFANVIPLYDALTQTTTPGVIGYDLSAPSNPRGIPVYQGWGGTMDCSNKTVVGTKRLLDIDKDYIEKRYGKNSREYRNALYSIRGNTNNINHGPTKQFLNANPDTYVFTERYFSNAWTTTGGFIDYKDICAKYKQTLVAGGGTLKQYSDNIEIGRSFVDITNILRSSIVNESVTFGQIRMAPGPSPNQKYESANNTGLSVQYREAFGPGGSSPYIYAATSEAGTGMSLIRNDDYSFIDSLKTIFEQHPEYYSASITSSYIDANFSFSGRNHKVIFPVASGGMTANAVVLDSIQRNVPVPYASFPSNPLLGGIINLGSISAANYVQERYPESIGNSGLINSKIRLIGNNYVVEAFTYSSDVLANVSYEDPTLKRLQTAGYTTYNDTPANGIRIDYHYNVNSIGPQSTSTLPFQKTIDVSSFIQQAIEKPVDKNGRYMQITNSLNANGLTPSFTMSHVQQEGGVTSINTPSLPLTLNGEQLVSIQSIGVTGYYDWTGLSPIDKQTSAAVTLPNNIELIGSNGLVTGIIGQPFSITTKYTTNTQADLRTVNVTNAFQNLISVNSFTQDVNIPSLSYYSGNAFLPIGSTGITFADGFFGEGTFYFNYNYGNDSSLNRTFNFTTSGLTSTTPQLSLTDTNQATTQYTFDINPNLIPNTIKGSDITSSFVPFGQTGPSGQGPNLPILGLTQIDLFQLYPDISSINLILYYYYGDALYNKYSSKTITQFESLDLANAITETNYILDKAQRYFTLPYAETQQPLYIVSIASNLSGYTFTEDPIDIRTYDYSTQYNYKLLKLTTSGFRTGTDLSNLVDINKKLNRSNIIFEKIPGRFNNFDDGSIDNFFQKTITTGDEQEFMTRLSLNQPAKLGRDGYLNQFFVFNNVSFNNSDYVGTLYAFATSITGPADPPPEAFSTLGLSVANGFRVDGTPKFITGTNDYTNGFTNQLIKFDYRNYRTDLSDEFNYNNTFLDQELSTFKMRVLLNSKSDKYDSTESLAYTFTSQFSLETGFTVTKNESNATFYGLSPNTTYNTSFLTYDQGATANTSEIRNFNFTTGVTGIVFDGNFTITQDSENDRKYDLSISNLFYRLAPGKLSSSLVGNTQYQLMIDMGDPEVQFINNRQPLPVQARFCYRSDKDLFIGRMPQSVLKRFLTSLQPVSISFYDGTSAITLTHDLEDGQYESLVYDFFGVQRQVLVNPTGIYNKDSYAQQKVGIPGKWTSFYNDTSKFNYVYFCLPAGYPRPPNGTVKIFTSVPYTTSGKYIISSIPQEIVDISVTNLKRGKTYYPKVFMQLASDPRYKTNCLFTDPITISFRSSITIENNTTSSFIQRSVIKNLQIYEEGYYEDISCITYDSSEMAFQVNDRFGKWIFTNSATSIIQFGKRLFSWGFPGDFLCDIEVEPSKTYDDLNLFIAHVDQTFHSIDNRAATDPFPGITGTCDSTGKVLTFGDPTSSIYHLNNMRVLAVPPFTTPAGETGGEVFAGTVSIQPHLFNTQISITDFNYYKYDKSFSYCIKYGYPELFTVLYNPTTGSTANGIITTGGKALQPLNYQNVNLSIPFLLLPNTKYDGYIYFKAFDQRYGANVFGTQRQLITFTTPESELFEMPDVTLTPLINGLVVEVGRTKNKFSGQLLELLNQPLQIQVFERNSEQTQSEFLNGLDYLGIPEGGGGYTYNSSNKYNVGDAVLYNLTLTNYDSYIFNRNEIAGSHGPIPDGSTGITALNGNPALGYGWSKVPNFLNSQNLIYEASTNQLVQRQDGTTGYFMIASVSGNKRYQVNIGIKIPGINYNQLQGTSGSTAYFNPLYQISTFVQTLPNKLIADSVNDVLPYNTNYYYSVGDFISYDGKIFECVVATNTSGIGPFGGYLTGELGSVIHWKLASTITSGFTGASGSSGQSQGATGKFLSDFHYKGSSEFLTDGIINISGEQIMNSDQNVYYQHVISKKQITNTNGIYIDESMYNPNNFLTYQPQISIDKEVSDETNPTYFDYNSGTTYGSFTGSCSITNITHSTANFNLSELTYNTLSTNLGVLNVMLPDSSIYIIGNTGSYTKEVSLSSLYYSGVTAGYGLTGILNNLPENKTFTDFKIYYKPYAGARYTDTFISIPSFTTPKALDIAYTYEVGINNIYLNITSFAVDGFTLPQDTFFRYSGTSGTSGASGTNSSNQALNFFFFLKGSDVGDPTKTTPISTAYISIIRNQSYKVLIRDATPLVTYDSMNLSYSYIDVNGKPQLISKILNLT